MSHKIIQAIILQISQFIYDPDMKPSDVGSSVVGATMMRDDYDDLILHYPELRKLAEQGLHLETLRRDSRYFRYYLDEIRVTFEYIKIEYQKLPIKQQQDEKIIRNLKGCLKLSEAELAQAVLKIGFNDDFLLLPDEIPTSEIFATASLATNREITESDRLKQYEKLVGLLEGLPGYKKEGS